MQSCLKEVFEHESN